MVGQEFATPAEALAHFGTKGMKWGVRNDKPTSSSPLKPIGPEKITRKLSNGDELTLERRPVTKLHKTIAKFSKSYVKNYNTGATLAIKANGKTVGSADFFLKSKDELYLNWISIDKSARGQGYATEIMKSTIELGPTLGVKKLTLDVPGLSPDARHIYENQGFKVTNEATKTNDMWGGLTTMEYKYD
jgi:RimJ/RimL family protein N-acetyltransferase